MTSSNTINILYLIISGTIMLVAVGLIITKSRSNSSRNKTHFEKYRNPKFSPAVSYLDYVWRKHYRLLILILTIIASYAVVYSDNIFNFGNISPTDELTALLLIYTGGLVFWNTRENYDLKQISQDEKSIQQKQFDFDNRPYLAIMYSAHLRELIHIFNKGKGLAIDVTIEPFQINEHGVRPLSIPAIEPGQKAVVRMGPIQKSAGLDGYSTATGNYSNDLKTHFTGEVEIGAVKLVLRYTDLLGTVYEAVFQADSDYEDSFRITSQKRVR